MKKNIHSEKNEFNKMILDILADYHNAYYDEIIMTLYQKYGDNIDSIYMEFFSKNSQAFNFIETINTKLKLAKYRYPNMTIEERETEILKYEWDHSSRVSDYEKDQMNWIKDFLKFVIYDMKCQAKEDGYKNINISYLNSGGYCHVYKIGNQVLKLGVQKYAENNNFSRNYVVANLSREFSGSYFMEITPYVKTSGINELEAYNLYDDERNLGYCWSDCKSTNIGILLFKNVPRYTNLSPLGYIFLGSSKEIENPKNKGEYVIVDRDFSYSLDKYNIEDVILNKCGNDVGMMYEKIYQYRKK